MYFFFGEEGGYGACIAAHLKNGGVHKSSSRNESSAITIKIYATSNGAAFAAVVAENYSLRNVDDSQHLSRSHRLSQIRNGTLCFWDGLGSIWKAKNAILLVFLLCFFDSTLYMSDDSWISGNWKMNQKC